MYVMVASSASVVAARAPRAPGALLRPSDDLSYDNTRYNE
jgi:hypothetical protein